MGRTKSLVCLLLLIAYCNCDVSELQQKINLEDIERDNLISEQMSQQTNDVEAPHPPQELHGPSVHASQHSYQIQHEIDGQHTTDDKYSRPHSEVHYQQHHGPQQHQKQYQQAQPEEQVQQQQTQIYQQPQQYQPQQLHHQQQHIQYVTIQPAEQHTDDNQKYESQSTSPPQYTPVHEEGRTYSAPSRHSLISPIQHTASATQSPYLAQQPQYVYVRAGPQAEQNQAPPSSQEQQEHTQEMEQPKEQNVAPVAPQVQQEYRYASIGQQSHGLPATAEYGHQQLQQHITYEQQPPATYEQTNAVDGPGVTYLQPHAEALRAALSGGYEQQPQPQYIQYIPYVPHGPAQQSYFMMVPTFRHSYVQPAGLALQYATQTQYASHPILQQQPQQHYHQLQQPIPVAPTDAYKHVDPNQESAVLKAPVTTAQPSIQYTVQPSHQYSPQSPKSAHHSPGATQVEIQQSVEYPSRQTIEYPSRQTVHYTHSLPKASIVHHRQNAISIPTNIPSYPQYASYHPQYQHLSSVPVATAAIEYQPQYRQQQSSHHGAHVSGNSSPTLDFFGAYNHKHTSLLASYVPSSVIVEKQRLLHLQQPPITTKLQHHYHPSSSGTASASLSSTPLHPVFTDQSLATAQHSEPSPVYNTIAYSAPNGYINNHLKRSPKIITASVDKPTTTTTITTAISPEKATKLTKVESA